MTNPREQFSAPESPAWLEGGGEAGSLMRAIDWSQTPLGPAEDWPQSLRTTVSICLNSRFPIICWWGPQMIQFYNDAYRPMLGATKHPRAMGQHGPECWPEVWHVIGPMLEGVMQQGQATWSEDQLLYLDRNNFLEECYFTFSYSPIRGDDGQVSGVFTAVTETTRRVLSERRLSTLNNLAARAAGARSVEQVCTAALQTLAENPADIPFALLYLLEDGGKSARLSGAVGLPAGGPFSPKRVPLDAGNGTASGWPLAAAASRGEAVSVDDLPAAFHLTGSQPPLAHPRDPVTPALPVRSALVLPIVRSGQETPYGFLVVGISPYRSLDEPYSGYLTLAAGQLAAAIANVNALEEERRRAQALAELDRVKTEFFSNISHEFRTPLTLILGPLQEALEMEDGMAPAVRSQMERARDNALRLLKLVNTLLDFSQLEAGRQRVTFEATDLAELTAGLVSVFRSAVEKAGLTLAADLPPLPEPVYVDREQWEKIVLNLLSNALKFTFEGEIRVRQRVEGSEVVLQVSDTGVGIPEDELPHLFERFHRVNEARARTHEGSGIGLALVRDLTLLHGGSVAVESTPGQGSTFTVRIPLGKDHLPPERVRTTGSKGASLLGAGPFLAEAMRWLPQDREREPVSQAAWLEDGEPASGRRRHPARILLVDDNADMRQYLRHLLSHYWTVETAPDGESALEILQRQRQEGRLPHLVLADVMMPRLDGFELLRRLRADPGLSSLPVILLSARAGEEAHLKGFEAGADDYLVKPFSARELVARVETHIELAFMRQKNQRRIAGLLESLPEAFWGLDERWNVIFANSRAAALCGQRVEELSGRPFWEVLTGLSPELRRTLEEAMEKRSSGKVEEFYEPGEQWLEFHFGPYEDGMVVIASEISERKRLARELEAEHALFQAVLHQMPSGVIIADAARGSVVLGNQVASSIWRTDFYPGRPILGQKVETGLKPDGQLLHGEDWPLERVIHTGQAIREEEIHYQHPDGTSGVLLANAAPVTGPDGEILAGVVVYHDITPLKELEAALRREIAHRQEVEEILLDLNQALEERVKERTRELEQANESLQNEIAERIRAEQALKESDALHRSILTSVSDAIFLTDESLRFTHVWPNVEPIFDCTEEEVAAMGSVDQLLGAQVIDPQRLIAAGELENIEHQIVNRSGERRSLLINAKRVDLQGGKFLFSIRDNTSRRAAEDALRQHARRMEALAELTQELGNAGGNLEPALQHTVREVAAQIGDRCALALLEFDETGRQKLQVRAWHAPGGGPHPGGPAPELLSEAGSAWVERVCRSGRPLLLRERTRTRGRQEDPGDNAAFLEQAGGDILLVPVTIQGQVSGVLGVARGQPGSTYSQEEQFFLQQLANHLGLALTNRRLVMSLEEELAERERTEVQLAHQAYLLENISDALVATDENHNITSWNRAARDTYGWEAHEAIGRSSDELLRTEYIDGSLEEVRSRLKATGQYRGTGLQYSRDGQKLWMDIHTIALYDEDDNHRGYVSLNRDISERRQAEEALRASEARFRAIFEQTATGITLMDLQGRHLEVNPAYERMMGYSRDELYLKSYLEIDHPDDRETSQTLFNELASGKREDYRMVRRCIRKDGGVIWTLLTRSLVRDLDGSPLFVIGMNDDITEQKRVEAALRESEERFRAIFEASAIGIVLQDLEGRYLMANAVFMEITGYSLAELQQLSFLDLVHPDEAPSDRLLYAALVAGEQQDYRIERRYRRKDGSWVWVRITRSAMRDAENNTEFVICLVDDISDRKQAEADLLEMRRRLVDDIEAERLRISREIHDGPIQDLFGLTFQMAGLRSDLEEGKTQPVAAALGEIQEHSTEVISELRRICVELRPPSLNLLGLEKAIIAHAEAFMQAFPDLQVELDLTPDRQLIPERIRLTLFRVYQQAVINVVRHAKAGRVVVRLRVLPEENRAVLEVQDDGQGFVLPKKIVSLSHGGHLGLVGSMERVEAVGGRLEIESAPGKGTLVRAIVPLE